jgi:hypothetical protein
MALSSQPITRLSLASSSSSGLVKPRTVVTARTVVKARAATLQKQVGL